MDRYVEDNPDDEEALTILGNAYMEQEYYAKAIEVYDSILTENPNKPTILFNKAQILLTAIGDAGEGMQVLEKAITAGFSEKQKLLELARDPELINPEQVEEYLLEKQLIDEEELLEEELLDTTPSEINETGDEKSEEENPAKS